MARLDGDYMNNWDDTFSIWWWSIYMIKLNLEENSRINMRNIFFISFSLPLNISFDLTSKKSNIYVT